MKGVGVCFENKRPCISVIQEISWHGGKIGREIFEVLHTDNGGEYTFNEFENYF